MSYLIAKAKRGKSRETPEVVPGNDMSDQFVDALLGVALHCQKAGRSNQDIIDALHKLATVAP